MSFKEVNPSELNMNPFTTIGKDWLLITAGNEEKCNTMTASWGAMGVMWGKNAVTVYIRPQRYTKEFVDREDTFTISVLGKDYRKALNYCGTVSGKGSDKIKDAGLTPYYTDGTAGIEEADMIMYAEKCIMTRSNRSVLTHRKTTENGILRKIIIPCILQKF